MLQVESTAHASPPPPTEHFRVERQPSPPATFEFFRDPFDTLESISKRADMLVTRVLGTPTVILAHPALVTRVLNESKGTWRKDRFSQRASDVFGQGLLLSEGEIWKNQRRLINPAFMKARLEAYRQVFEDISNRHVKSWPENGVIDAAAEMARLTLDVAVSSLFGANISAEDAERVGSAFSSVSDFFASPLAMLPFEVPRWLPLPILRRHAKALAELNSVVNKLVRDRRENRQFGNDLLSMLLNPTEAAPTPSDVEIRDQLVTFLLAGHETSALSLTFALFELGKNASLREALFEEVDTHSLRAEDPESFTVTHQTIKESLRLYPPAYALSRENAIATRLGGLDLEPGTLVFAAPWTMHRDARWHPNPLDFRPSRWTTEYENTLPDAAFLPFGFGPRKCIGARFAMMESVYILSAIARSHDWESVDEKLPPLQPAITCRPTQPVKVRVRRRQHLT